LPYSGVPQCGCGNADEHPSLSPEHCTLTPNVKAGDFQTSRFFYRTPCWPAERSEVLHCGVKVFLRCGEQNVLRRGAKIG